MAIPTRASQARNLFPGGPIAVVATLDNSDTLRLATTFSIFTILFISETWPSYSVYSFDDFNGLRLEAVEFAFLLKLGQLTLHVGGLFGQWGAGQEGRRGGASSRRRTEHCCR